MIPKEFLKIGFAMIVDAKQIGRELNIFTLTALNAVSNSSKALCKNFATTALDIAGEALGHEVPTMSKICP